MRKTIIFVVCLLTSMIFVQAQKKFKEQAEVWIDINKVENHINPKLYGFLLEHIYHSVSNGIWGENVWNRSFEE